MARLTRWLCAVLLVAAPTPLKAQRLTLDSVLTALSAGARVIGFDTLDPGRARGLDSLTAELRASRVAELTVDDFAAAATASPGVAEIFRWDRERVARASQPFVRPAFVRLQQLVLPRPAGLGPRIFQRRGAADYQLYVGAMETLQNKAIVLVQAASTEKLRRYEIKFGPASPRLNPVETVLNYALERVPHSGFGPNERGPGPLELVVTYSSSDITANGGTAAPLRLVSGLHAGVRIYRFTDAADSRSPLGQLVHPVYVALGGSIFAPNDLPLQWPFHEGNRGGGFVEWGRLRAAVALGANWRFLLGTSAQLVPHVL